MKQLNNPSALARATTMNHGPESTSSRTIRIKFRMNDCTARSTYKKFTTKNAYLLKSVAITN